MKQYYKLEFYVPETHCESVKTAIFAAGAGQLGNYSSCCWQTSGTGQFRPGDGSNPFIGEKDKIEQVAEYKVELICREDCITKVIQALKESHPYETPAYQYWKVCVE